MVLKCKITLPISPPAIICCQQHLVEGCISNINLMKAVDLSAGTYSPEQTNTMAATTGNFSFRLDDHQPKSTSSASNFSFRLDDDNAFGSSLANNNFKFSLDNNAAQSSSTLPPSGFSTNAQNVPFGSSGFANSSSAFSSSFGSSNIPSSSQNAAFPSSGFGTRSNVLQNDRTSEISSKDISNSEASPYSKPSELSETQIKQFKSHTFSIGMIPTLPPPEEVC